MTEETLQTVLKDALDGKLDKCDEVSKSSSKALLAVGDHAKVIGENIVFMIYGLTKGREFIPDGWYLDIENVPHNPKFCEKYKGAISAIKDS